MKSRVVGPVLVFLAWLVPLVGQSADVGFRESLSGLPGAVFVERLSPEAERYGLTRDAIRADVEG